MTKIFNSEDAFTNYDYEKDIWEEYQLSKIINIKTHHGVVTITGLIYDIWDFNDNELMIVAGYKDFLDELNIPDEFFESIFPNDEVEWNCAEATHHFIVSPDETIDEAKKRISDILEKNGFNRAV